MTTPDTKGYKAGSAGEHPPDVAAASAATPPARAGGAPAGNQNALQSGASAWLKAGTIPRCYRALRRQLRELAVGLAGEVESAKGRQASVYELCVIGTVVRHSGRVALLERWLAREHKTMSLSDRLAVLKEIGAASTSRDKALQSLGIDRDGGSDLDRFYAQLRSGAIDAAPADDDAAEATVGDDKGNGGQTT